ncbi:UDP-glucosyltransferase 29 [Linum grandiflorum]
MEEEATNSGEIRILMFPWLAHGHISPFIELANQLVSRRPNFHVYFCSSPINLQSITKLIKHPSPCIELIDLNLPSLPDLPPHSHTTKGLPAHLIPTLLKALDMASSDFSQILTKLSPDLLICDVLQPWAPKLALSLIKIPSICFITTPAIVCDFGFTNMNNCALPLQSNHVADYAEAESTPSLLNRYLWSLERSSTMLLMKTFRDIEAKYIDRASKFIGKSILTVGPLVPDDDGEEEQEPDKEIISWLNKKDKSSVVYISFGSECYLSTSQIQELAHALLILLVEKACPVNFIWALRFPHGEGVEISEALPKGFMDEVGPERVYLVEGWAPQRRILRHGSVRGFVSHCGWSSVMEGMKYGVPIVGVPLLSDQPMNARLVEEIGVGLKVEKIERVELVKVIEEVVIGERNGEFRDKAKEIQNCLLQKGDREIDDAIEHLMEQEFKNSRQIRILMFPWLAHGHISPFLELANKLISRRPNVKVYLCSSPINLESTTQLIKHPSSRIEFVELHLPSLPDLPPHYHTTKGLPTHLIPTLFQALDMASSDFAQILTKLSPDLLIFDYLQPWAPKLASSLKIPSVCFMITSAILCDISLTSMTQFHGAFPLRSNHVVDYAEAEFTPSLADRFIWSLERSSTMLLMKTVRDIEVQYIGRVSKFIGKSILTVGPLVPDDGEWDQEPDNEIIDWLNKKDESSVVYISFGSECYLSSSQIQELAHALLILLVEKACPVSFIWVLRFPRGEEVEISEALPKGFMDAVGPEKVYLVEGWAPQRRILRHGSIGGFVSHCGWSSVMEGMKYGVPIVGVPLYTDQPLNARLVEEIGVGLKVEKIERVELAKVIEEVVVGETKVEFRNKAKEIKNCLLQKGDCEIDEAIERLVHLCSEFSI